MRTCASYSGVISWLVLKEGKFFTVSLCVEAWIVLPLLSTVQMSRGTRLEPVPRIRPVSPPLTATYSR